MGNSSGNKLASVEMYDSSTREWTSMPPLATARSEHSCTAMGSLLFVVGGADSNGEALASVEMYDTNTNEWTSMPPLATACCGHSCTAMGSLLFVVGGQDSNDEAVSSSEMYDSITSQWQAIEESASIPAVTSKDAVVCEVIERPSRWWS